MSDGELLLRAILEHPDDDTPRLVYADWLDEQGEPRGKAHARFIRRQITELPPVHLAPLVILTEWETVLGKQPHQCARTAGLDGSVVEGDGVSLVFRRGFVEECRCTLAGFLEHAAELFAHPIERVRLVDKAAFGHTTGLMSLRSSANRGIDRTWREVIPAELFFPTDGETQYFPDQDHAANWISDRCVAYGRAAFENSRSIASAGSAPDGCR